MTLTESEFWAIVDQINWGKNYNTINTDVVQYGLCIELGEDKCRSLGDYFDHFAGKIYKALTTWEEQHRTSCCLGDDGFGDLSAHVVGLGQEQFERYCADPSLAYALGVSGKFGESFSYCIPHGSTFERMQSLPKWKGEVLDELANIREKFSCLGFIADEVESLMLDAETFTMDEKKELNKHWEELANDARDVVKKFTGTAEQLDSLREAADYFRGWMHRNYVSDVMALQEAKRQLSTKEARS